ncbi:hypothetical protein E4U50_003052 [Claviceps purpurea]|nr:hypothetical protein E4U50_003052 [Claviceps purpurea]
MFSLQNPVKNPKGYHLTITYKLQRHIDSKRHIRAACTRMALGVEMSVSSQLTSDVRKSEKLRRPRYCKDTSKWTGTKFTKEKDDAAPEAELSNDLQDRPETNMRRTKIRSGQQPRSRHPWKTPLGLILRL